MPGIRRGIPVTQLARDYGTSLNEFSHAIIDLIGQEWIEADAGARPSRHREICAAVSAAMLAAFNASSLAAEEREKLQHLTREVLLPFWTLHCAGDDPELADYINSRALHYLAGSVPDSRVKSAVNIVAALLDAIDAPLELRPLLKERLTPAFAHRMVADVYRINEVHRKNGIELPVLATVCALLQMALCCGTSPARTALRLTRPEQPVQLDRQHLDGTGRRQQETRIQRRPGKSLLRGVGEFAGAGRQHAKRQPVRLAGNALCEEAQFLPGVSLVGNERGHAAAHQFDLGQAAAQEQINELAAPGIPVLGVEGAVRGVAVTPMFAGHHAGSLSSSTAPGYPA